MPAAELKVHHAAELFEVGESVGEQANIGKMLAVNGVRVNLSWINSL